jgi:minor histocompatibility antigen H13
MDPEDTDEVMTTKDAAMFPVYGSLVLFSLYLLTKHFNKELLSTLISTYFAFLG